MASVVAVLSSFDDYPLHQTPFPVARTASTDLNHYDRYFFHGATADRRLVFGTAMGLYPNRHVADASFSVIVRSGDGDDDHGREQISVHASRRAPADRADANTVGPIQVEVLEPLHALRVHVDAPDQGVRADLTFVRRSPPIEEPHFEHRVGNRTVMDSTRLTQFGGWEGWIEVDGELTDLEPGETLGVRDRSWGIRTVGERAPTGAPIADPQFFWLWAPINFETFSTHFDVNELFDGHRWHHTGFIAPVSTPDATAEPEVMRSVDYRIEWEPGTRRFRSFEIDLVPWDGTGPGDMSTVRLERHFDFYMAGLGYLHPEWGHGVWRGELDVGGERWSVPVPGASSTNLDPTYIHIQSIVTATTSGALGEHQGSGILEQLAIGRHDPTGLTGIFDPAS